MCVETTHEMGEEKAKKKTKKKQANFKMRASLVAGKKEFLRLEVRRVTSEEHQNPRVFGAKATSSVDDNLARRREEPLGGDRCSRDAKITQC